MEKSTKKQPWFWTSAVASIITRLVLIIYFPNTLNFSSRPEISTPLTSIRRLAEGYWLKQSSMSPYAGSMYHGSPLLLSILGPLTIDRGEGQRSHLLFSLAFVVADFITAMLIRSIGQLLQIADSQSLKSLGAGRLLKVSENFPSGDIAALVYLWNPLTIITCLGYSTAPIENLMIVLSLYGACKRLVPLAAFGWVIASHLSLYPAILVIPLVLLIGSGLDTPPRKLFVQNKYGDDQNELSSDTHRKHKGTTNGTSNLIVFSWRRVVLFFFWASVWAFYVLVLCSISLKEFSGLGEMFKRTYGFILSVEDLSPNIGLLWYFFAEVFDFFRDFFLIVFHINILFMVLPLAIRLHHRPCFLAFVYIAISSVLKSYPSVGDSALYLGLLGLFVNALADMQFSFFLFSGYLGTLLLSPVMHNLWIWRGTGNANFYFATAMAYACFQIILVVESVSSMLSHDRALKQATTPVSKKVL
ncbi:phosphatidylinositol glycan anchor biosynthesis class U protein-like [Cynara cardunculus var. scolymus]|uniref:phosphatidylinositol glycan anchor biosynthesis class U protein-like n=1 Tax=Cynara cardunculus var. scolymus TaxID=59895 RepID=UPI000D62C544|nr:phosphatidylinositol glycan anchor biosynthesis class U protein-like [Cynara cardunculus var. scolymus]